MGGISAIFGLGSRQQEKVTAAALECCQNGDAVEGEDRGVPQDAGEAVVWVYQAAEQGHAGAQFNLGVKYDTGRRRRSAGLRRSPYVVEPRRLPIIRRR